ncbi:MAG: hypothetical protein H8Z69_02605 [Nanohaloarchaea archaeon]|nr:hypothetical protein [Candidatus Nanohaloarchaea archaeon]
MRKILIVLLLIPVIPAASGFELTEIQSFDYENKLKSFETSKEGDFGLEINQKDILSVYNKSSKLYSLNPEGRTAFSIDYRKINNTAFWATGTKFSDPKWFVHSQGDITSESAFRRAVDSVKFISDNRIAAGNGRIYGVFSLNGKQRWLKNSNKGLKLVGDHSDFDEDGRLEVIFGNYGSGPLRVIESETGKIEWSAAPGDKKFGKFIDKSVLIRHSQGLELRGLNGSVKWSVKSPITTSVVLKDNKMLYGGKNSLYIRNQKGELLHQKNYEHQIDQLQKLPKRDLMAGIQARNLSIFNYKGEKIFSSSLKNYQKGLKLTQYDPDQEHELALALDQEVKILDLEKAATDTWNHSLNQTVFVGKDRSMLEAVALNSTAYVSNSTEKIQEENVLGVGVSSANSTDNVNKVFNRTDCVFVKDRVKAVYASALAAKNGSCLSFSRERCSSSLVNKSLEEVKNRFIEVFDPNHVVVADLDSDSGVLAAEMAVKQVVYPVNFDSDFSYQNLNSTTNKYNGVIRLDRKINNAFKRIGENPNTVFEGKHISLLNAPRKVYEDPVEKGILFSDKEDGKHFTSDLNYGDLDNDSFLEAGVGRYPSDSLEASKLFHRSLEREIGSKAVLGSEYLHKEWPVVLATFGGGLRHGSSVENVLRKEGYNTTHFVERRAEPLQTLYSLTPTGISSFLKNTDRAESLLDSVGSSAGSMAKTSLTVIRGLKFAEEGLEMLYEYKWSDYEFNLERGLKRMEGWEVPLGKTPTEVIQKGVVQVFYNFLWPESHPKLEKQGFLGETRGSEIIYFQGRGNSNNWKLPSHNQYNVSISPSDIPELEKPIVWDSTVMAGKKDAEMRNSFIEKGASAHLGFSTVNYAAFSSIIDSEFFRVGKNLGNSLKSSVNSLRETGLVYNPTSFHKNGVKDKMESSLSLMGNPEMPKDPIKSDYFEFSKKCEKGECVLNATLRPEIGFEDGLSYNSSSELKIAGAPITPLYSFSEKIPGNIQQVETSSRYTEKTGLELPETQLLTSSGGYENISREFESFPSTKSNYSKGEDFRFVQSGIMKTGNSYEVVQNASIKVRYSTPLTASLEGENVARLEVYSNKKRNATVAYQIGGSRTSFETSLEKGINIYNISRLGQGEHFVEAAVITDSNVAKASKTYEIGDLDFNVSGDLREGGIGELVVEFKNNNSFKIERSISPKLSENLVFDLLEDENRSVVLKPGESEKVVFDVIGLNDSSSTVIVGGKRFQLKQAGATSEKVSKDFEGLKRSISSGSISLEFSVNRSTKKAAIQSPEVSLSHLSRPEKSVYQLKTSNFSVKKLETPEIKYIVSSSKGRFVATSNGFNIEGSGLSREKALNLIGIAEKEFSKLDKFRLAVSES